MSSEERDASALTIDELNETPSETLTMGVFSRKMRTKEASGHKLLLKSMNQVTSLSFQITSSQSTITFNHLYLATLTLNMFNRKSCRAFSSLLLFSLPDVGRLLSSLASLLDELIRL